METRLTRLESTMLFASQFSIQSISYPEEPIQTVWQLNVHKCELFYTQTHVLFMVKFKFGVRRNMLVFALNMLHYLCMDIVGLCPRSLSEKCLHSRFCCTFNGQNIKYIRMRFILFAQLPVEWFLDSPAVIIITITIGIVERLLCN